MWGHGRSHINLSPGSSEDSTAVLLHHPLRVCVKHRQRGQCGPHVPAGPPALPQVGIMNTLAPQMFNITAYKALQ